MIKSAKKLIDGSLYARLSNFLRGYHSDFVELILPKCNSHILTIESNKCLFSVHSRAKMLKNVDFYCFDGQANEGPFVQFCGLSAQRCLKSSAERILVSESV